MCSVGSEEGNDYSSASGQSLTNARGRGDVASIEEGGEGERGRNSRPVQHRVVSLLRAQFFGIPAGNGFGDLLE